MSSQNLIFKLLILIDRADRLTGMLCYENISDYGNRQRSNSLYSKWEASVNIGLGKG